MKKTIWILIFCVLFAFISCTSENNEPQDINKKEDSPEEIIKKDSSLKAEMTKKHDIFPHIKYRQIYVADSETLRSLKEEYQSSDSIPLKNKVFLTLNRKEMRFMRVKDTVVVPDTIINDIRAYSVFPQYYHGARNIPKIIMVSNKYQCYAAYENGVQVRFAAANTGKEKTQTYPGRYALVWRDRLRKSSLDSTWILPFTWNFHRYAGNAFHQFEMPGYAASHSCIRQFLSDAKWLFEWGEGVEVDTAGKHIWLSGTPVIIIDAFDFTRPKTGPWVARTSNKDVILDLPEKPMEVEEALIPISQIPENIRGWIPQRKRYLSAEDSLRARGVIREDVTITPSIDYNKRRREKAARKAAELKKLEAAKQSDSSKTNIKIIKKNLEMLEGKPVEIKENEQNEGHKTDSTGRR